MQVVIRGTRLPDVLEELKIFAKARGLEIIDVQPLNGTRGRPRAQVDFVRICDAVQERIDEKGAIRQVADQYSVSPAWIYKWVIPLIRAEVI